MKGSRLIFVGLFLCCFSLLFLSCSTIRDGYSKTGWSRFESGLEVLPKIEFQKVAESPDKKKVLNSKLSPEVKAYSSRIQSALKKRVPDFKLAESVIDDMVSECKGKSGVAQTAIKYITTIVSLIQELQLKVSIINEYPSFYQLKSKASNHSNILTPQLLNGRFPWLDFTDKSRKEALDLMQEASESLCGKSLAMLAKYKDLFPRDELLKLSMLSGKEVISFVDTKTNDFSEKMRDSSLVERPYDFNNEFINIRYKSDLAVYRSGEKVFVRATGYALGKEKEDGFSKVTMSLYKLDPLAMLNSGISLRSPEPLPSSKPLKRWTQKVKTQFVEGIVGLYGFDTFNISSIETLFPPPAPPDPPEFFDLGDVSNIPVSVSEPGFYLVGVETDVYSTYTPILVSDLSMITKYDAEVLLVFCDNSRKAGVGQLQKRVQQLYLLYPCIYMTAR